VLTRTATLRVAEGERPGRPRSGWGFRGADGQGAGAPTQDAGRRTTGSRGKARLHPPPPPHIAPMRCYSWNVNGIRAVQRKCCLPWDVIADGDLIAIQETKAKVDQLESEVAEPDGWNAFWHS